MASKRKLVALQAIVVLRELKDIFEEEQERRRKRRKYWINPFLSTREAFDIELNLLSDISWGGSENYFKNFTRLNINDFEDLLSKVLILSNSYLCAGACTTIFICF